MNSKFTLHFWICKIFPNEEIVVELNPQNRKNFTGLFTVLLLIVHVLSLSSCLPGQPSKIQQDSNSRSDSGSFKKSDEVGYASWYGEQFDGKKTASGEIYNMYEMTAAHRSAPFGTHVLVTNLDNNKQITVKINDRGPFVRGRIIDLSKKAAQELGITGIGTAKVSLKFLHQTPIDLGNIFIQTASFESEKNAQLHIDTLQNTISDITARIYKEKSLFRVRTGPYSSEETAKIDLNRLKKSNFNGFILHSN